MNLQQIGPWLVAAVAFSAGVVQAQPRFSPPAGAGRWQLGVAVRNLPGGVMITRVVPASVAQQNGLEAGDTILAVNGAAVGFVNGRLFDLEDQLNRQADFNGRVTLTIRNGRNGQVGGVRVRLAPANNNGNWNPQPPPFPVPPDNGFWPPAWPPNNGGWPQPQPPANNAAVQINAWYIQYFGRQADQAGLWGWVQQVNQGMPLPEVHANLLASAEFYDRGGNNPAGFVNALFVRVANRQPAPNEMQYWTERLRRDFRGNRLLLTREFLRGLGQY